MNIRYSMLDSFITCPAKFYRSYIMPNPVREDSVALRYGSALHFALRAHFEGEDAREAFVRYWWSLKDMNLKYDSWDHQQLSDVTTNVFLPNFIKLHAKKFQNVKMEEQLEAEFFKTFDEVAHKTKHVLQGTYDMACEYEGELSIIDWKTSSREYKADKIHKNPQMWIYAYLYQRKYGHLPKFLVYKVFIKSEGRIQTLKTEVTQALLDQQMNNVENIAKQMLETIESGNYYCNYNSCFCKSINECLGGLNEKIS